MHHSTKVTQELLQLDEHGEVSAEQLRLLAVDLTNPVHSLWTPFANYAFISSQPQSRVVLRTRIIVQESNLWLLADSLIADNERDVLQF